MADDALIAGAAAPAGTRRIRSAAVLDAIWVLLVASVVVVSSFFALIDLPSQYLRTQEAPLRVYVVVVPAVALALAIAAIIRRSAPLAAVATGTLVPSIALCGSLGASLFLDAASPFTDAGVPLAVAAALLGIVMVMRWFVYLTPPVPGVEPRPSRLASRGLLGVGFVLAVTVVIEALLDDPVWSASFVVSTFCLLLAPFVVVAAGAARSVESSLVAAAGCSAQAVAVVVATLDDGDVDLDSALALRTGVIGLLALVVGAVVAIAGADRAAAAPDDEANATSLTVDEPEWRWSADDEF